MMPVRSLCPLALALVVPILVAPATALAAAIGPSSYGCFDATQTTGIGASFTGTCSAESPLAQGVRDGDFQYFHLEDFEAAPNQGAFQPLPTTAPGLTVDAGSGGLLNNNFSVDADDGSIDGLASFETRSGQSGIAQGATITFDDGVLGNLPTHAGFVFTFIGNGVSDDLTVTFFGPGSVTLGSITETLTPGSSPLGNARDSNNDLFFGWSDGGGIESFSFSFANAIGFDHVQYGYVPEPSTATLFSLGLVGIAAVRRRAAAGS
jgi:hypothetical protein